jgi:hypothetical protein
MVLSWLYCQVDSLPKTTKYIREGNEGISGICLENVGLNQFYPKTICLYVSLAIDLFMSICTIFSYIIFWDAVTKFWDENLLWFFLVFCKTYFEANQNLEKVAWVH